MYVAATGIGSPIFLEDNDTAMKSGKKQDDNNLWTSDSNGKIDTTIYQGYAGDCALLTTLLGIAGTEEGAQAIKDAIQITKNFGKKEYVVTFKGTGEKYTITQDKLDGANRQWKDGKTGRYSYGDNDMTILELALEQAFLKSKDPELRYLVDNFTNDNQGTDKLNGVNPASVAYLLMGKDSDWYTKTKKENTVLTHFNANQDYKTKDINGKEVTLKGNSYYIISIAKDKQTVDVYDPKTGETVTIKSADFLRDVSSKDRTDDINATRKAFEDFEKNSDSMALVFTVNNETDANKNVVKDANGKDVQLSKEAHAYNVKEVKNGIVTLVNPHNSSEEIKVTLESLLSLTSFDCYTIDLTKPEEEQKPIKPWWKNIFKGVNASSKTEFTQFELVA